MNKSPLNRPANHKILRVIENLRINACSLNLSDLLKSSIIIWNMKTFKDSRNNVLKETLQSALISERCIMLMECARTATIREEEQLSLLSVNTLRDLCMLRESAKIVTLVSITKRKDRKRELLKWL